MSKSRSRTTSKSTTQPTLLNTVDAGQQAASPKIPTEDQVSAGGVAFRRAGDHIEVAIVSALPSRRWQLPKGLVDVGETPDIAALREVREEAGIEAEIIHLIETVEYWYVATRQNRRIRYHKFVHFFLMRAIGGDVANHDHEVAEARWVRLDEAEQMLAFKSERSVVQQAGVWLAANPQ